MSDRHYRPARGTHPCKAAVSAWAHRHFTTDVERVTCVRCLYFIGRTAANEIERQRLGADALTPSGLRRAARRRGLAS